MYDVHVRFVDEDELPESQPWVIGVTDRGERFLFIKKGAFSPAIIEQAWLAGLNLPHVPAQRQGGHSAIRLVV